MTEIIVSLVISTVASLVVSGFICIRYFIKIDEGWKKTFKEMKEITLKEIEKRMPR